MERIYESLFSAGHLFSEQLGRCMLPELPEDGPLVVLVGPDRHLTASDDGRLNQWFPEKEILFSFCDRIDDGQDPVVGVVDDGCLIGTELYTERVNAGYLLIVMAGYTPQTIQTHMDLVELLFSQVRLICSLVEKNNQLHQLQLNHMSRTSPVLNG